ncbi:unnamed protein product [Dracunculus medinensis]|uniref:Peroxin/Ferlin domain-containing protein n=1 Tax=Dracunculus medinensis TaxID=318479 RepID=A0A0N4U2V5_DRAME|nr:unnamed protein product [Dracunculus medinensis]
MFDDSFKSCLNQRHTGHCYTYLCNTYTTIRRTVSTYENHAVRQCLLEILGPRWYPLFGWSSRTLPSDRAFFTDETVDIIQPSNSFDSPSVGWEWEQAWMIDTNEQSYDKEMNFVSVSEYFMDIFVGGFDISDSESSFSLFALSFDGVIFMLMSISRSKFF